MKVTLNKNSYSFKSGLSKKDIARLNEIRSENAQKYFKSQNVKSDFKDNNTYCALNLLCSEILNRLGITKKPKQIVVFDKIVLIKPYPDTFCIAATKRILTNEPPFKPISLFFQDDKYTFEEMNEIAQDMKKNNFISSDNFMTLVLHEWAHSLHFNFLYSKFDNDENKVREYLKQLKQMEFTSREQEIIAQYLGSYVYNGGKIKAVEVVAESINKIICSTLDEKEVKIKCGTKEALDNTPNELKKLMKKILDFKA